MVDKFQLSKCLYTYKVLFTFPGNFRQSKLRRFWMAQMLKICANLYKSCNNMMSNDGLIIENMDLSLIHLAVQNHCCSWKIFDLDKRFVDLTCDDLCV